MSKILGNDDN